MGKTIIIYGKTKERAFNKLQSILDKIQRNDVNKVIKSRNSFIVETKNDNIYKAIVANNNARIHRWDYAIIDIRINTDIKEDIIYPTFKWYKYGDIKNKYSFYYK